jgi:hypothetical protein
MYAVSISLFREGPSWPWSYGSLIYNYLCNQCLSSLMLWVRISIRARCTTLCDKVCQLLASGRWFSLGTPVSSTNNTNHHDITEILLKVALNTIKQQTNKYYSDNYCASISINYHANTLIVAVLEIKIRADGQYICNNKKITIIKRFMKLNFQKYVKIFKTYITMDIFTGNGKSINIWQKKRFCPY